MKRSARLQDFHDTCIYCGLKSVMDQAYTDHPTSAALPTYLSILPPCGNNLIFEILAYPDETPLRCFP